MKGQNLKYLCLFFLFFAGYGRASATHIAGGEISYTYLDSGKYKIRLAIFIDCYNGTNAAIALDSIAIIGFYDPKTLNLINVDQVRRSDPTRIEELHYNCVSFNTNACVDQYVYEYTKEIDPGQNGVVVAFQRCCRNGTITNLVNPQDVGATYWAYIPPTSIVRQNSSPYFKKLPPNFLCTDAPLIFDHSAIDPDGDSLVYSLVAPFVGADRINNRPNPPSRPTYGNVVFRPPYNVNNMMGSTSQLKIDPKTGELRVTPDIVGQFVVGIKVSEYRNGVLLSETVRDYQFNVAECTFIVQANFINAERVCGDTVLFTNESINADYYKWDFGIENRSDDTSDIFNPFWLYPEDGRYKISLEVEKNNCRDTFYNYVDIVHADSIYSRFDLSETEGCEKLEVEFVNKSDPTPDWYWDLGDGNEAIHNSNPPKHVYEMPGEYMIQLIIIDSTKCNISDTSSKPVNVYAPPESNLSIDSIGCFGKVFYSNLSDPSLFFKWDFDTYDTSSDSRDPEITYTTSGLYQTRLIVWDQHCADTFEIPVQIDIENYLSADIAPMVDDGCVPIEVFFDQPGGLDGDIRWDMGDGTEFRDTFISSYTFTEPGNYTIRYRISNDTSCNVADSFTVNVFVPEQPEAYFDVVANSCSGEIGLFNGSEKATSYIWDFGNGDISNEFEPFYEYEKGGEYRIRLIVDGGNDCPDTAETNVQVTDIGLNDLMIPNIFTPNQDSYNDCFKISGVNMDCYEYEFIVYNRWGDKVFSSTDLSHCWDGRSESGKLYPEGTYFGIYRLTDKHSNELTEISNTITLLR